MSVPGARVVIDLSHHNKDPDFAAARAAGIRAVIHKATEGATWQDKTYHERRAAAKAAGLLWGSYHFSSGVDPLDQLDNYLGYARPADDEAMVLDWEESHSGRHMSLDDANRFIEAMVARTGRHPIVYGGHLLRECVNGSDHPRLARCPLWYARYNAAPIGIPPVWPHWTLWQYSDGTHGPEPEPVPGIGHCDRNSFNGLEDDLVARWPLS